MDGAEPSTNGVSASNLYRLGSLLEDEDYNQKARKTVDAFATEMTQHPFVFCTMLDSVVASRLGVRNVTITGEDSAVEDAIKKSRLRLKPNTSVSRLGGRAKSGWLGKRNALLAAMREDKPGVQVCEGGVCREELEAKDMEKALKVENSL